MISESIDINTIDIIALSLIGISTLIGVIRGFTHDFFGTAALIFALFVTFWGEPYYMPVAEHFLGGTPFLGAVSGLTVFLVVSAIFTIAIDRLGDFVKGSSISSLDRTVGLAFGFVRGAFLVCFIYFIVGIITPKLPENMIKARFAPWYLKGAHTISEWVPEGTFGLKTSIPIADFDPKKIYNYIESMDETVENMSTLKPVSPDKKDQKGTPKDDEQTVW